MISPLNHPIKLYVPCPGTFSISLDRRNSSAETLSTVWPLEGSTSQTSWSPRSQQLLRHSGAGSQASRKPPKASRPRPLPAGTRPCLLLQKRLRVFSGLDRMSGCRSAIWELNGGCLEFVCYQWQINVNHSRSKKSKASH